MTGGVSDLGMLGPKPSISDGKGSWASLFGMTQGFYWEMPTLHRLCVGQCSVLAGTLLSSPSKRLQGSNLGA